MSCKRPLVSLANEHVNKNSYSGFSNEDSDNNSRVLASVSDMCSILAGTISYQVVVATDERVAILFYAWISSYMIITFARTT